METITFFDDYKRTIESMNAVEIARYSWDLIPETDYTTREKWFAFATATAERKCKQLVPALKNSAGFRYRVEPFDRVQLKRYDIDFAPRSYSSFIYGSLSRFVEYWDELKSNLFFEYYGEPDTTEQIIARFLECLNDPETFIIWEDLLLMQYGNRLVYGFYC